MGEVEIAVDGLKSGKSPGPDRLSAAFYKEFKSSITPLSHVVFVEVEVEAFDRGSFPPSLTPDHTVSISKSKEEIKFCTPATGESH